MTVSTVYIGNTKAPVRLGYANMILQWHINRFDVHIMSRVKIRARRGTDPRAIYSFDLLILLALI